MMPKRASTKLARIFMALFVLLLVLVGVIWWRRSPTFTFVGCYPLNQQLYASAQTIPGYTNISDNTSFYPAGLFLDSVTSPSSRSSPHTYALFNWDGRLCWSVNTPSFQPANIPNGFLPFLESIPKDSLPFYTRLEHGQRVFMPFNDGCHRLQAISPDGHMLAVAKLDWHQPIIIQRWHNGRPDGRVALPWKRPDGDSLYEERLQVSDSGRIWFIFSRHLWVIDGTHAAYGVCSSYDLGSGNLLSFLSHDDTMLEQRCLANGRSYYSDVRVSGDQVVTTSHAFLGQLAPLEDSIGGKVAVPSFYNSLRIPETDGWFYSIDEYSDIYCQKIGPLYRILDPRQQVNWAFTLTGVAQCIRCAPDGRFALVFAREAVQPSSSMMTLYKLPVLRDMLPARSYLLFFERPGRLRALLPLALSNTTASMTNNRLPDWNYCHSLNNAQIDAGGIRYNIRDWGMSPDGHRLALLVDGARNQHALLIYKW